MHSDNLHIENDLGVVPPIVLPLAMEFAPKIFGGIFGGGGNDAALAQQKAQQADQAAYNAAVRQQNALDSQAARDGARNKAKTTSTLMWVGGGVVFSLVALAGVKMVLNSKKDNEDV